MINSGELNKDHNCAIWNEALIQNIAGCDQKLVSELVPNCVVVWARAVCMELLLKVQWKIHYTSRQAY